MNILFFDTETTGLPLWREPSSHPDQPHIVDIAAELVSDETGDVLAAVNLIINPGVPISAEVAAIHGITDEIATEQGVTPEDALRQFFGLVERADLIVAHNIDFDQRLVRIAAQRLWRKEWTPPVQTFCTMKALTDVCRIPKANGMKGWKWPKLSEAISHLFGEELPDAHRAQPDMLACKRIYFHLRPIKVAPSPVRQCPHGEPLNKCGDCDREHDEATA